MADEPVADGGTQDGNVVGLYKAFDPNVGALADGAKLPGPESASTGDFGLGAYTRLAESVLGGSAPKGTFLEQVMLDYQKSITDWADRFRESSAKAVGVPSGALTFARMSYMPDSTSSNVLPWPDIHPEAIRKLIRENLAPNLIINYRVDDVLSYAEHSSQLWKKGWRIETKDGSKSPSDQDKKDILAAGQYIHSSAFNIKYDEVLKREKENVPDLTHFLGAITRDSLSFDLIAVSTDRDSSGKVVRYSPMPAGNIRLCSEKGYEGDAEIFAVLVDEGGAIVEKYKREELALYIRNARTDPEYAITMTRSYGTNEITIALKLIQIFQNVMDFNVDTFARSGVPHGMMVLTGNSWTQRQVDVLTRMWNNLKRGITKAVALPVLAAPKDGKVEIVDFSRIKGDGLSIYQDLLNLSIGCFCAVFRFPGHRLGYRTSGRGPDTSMSMGRTNRTSHQQSVEEDPGLAVLLGHLENFINQVIIWPRWAGLKFVFTGKNPREDAREYEARRGALTFDEARAESDLVALADLPSIKGDKDLEKVAKIMGLAPIDPNLSGVFQTVAQAAFAPKPEEQAKKPGATMTGSKDPAASEAHGKPAGVRRDSAAEKK